MIYSIRGRRISIILAAFILVIVSQSSLFLVSGNVPQEIEVTDDLLINQSVRLRPGDYRISDFNGDGVIKINADNVTIDAEGVNLIGEKFAGFGISMNGHSNLTIRNINIQGFQYGIRIENASNVLISNSNVSGNYKDTTTGFLDIGLDEVYGGGILFKNVSSSTVSGNVLTNQSTGLEMIGSNSNVVFDNTTSSGPEGQEQTQNSCWGIRLSGSTNNLIRGNRNDYVDRRRYNLDSGDSAGILLVSGSHDNRIISNSMTYSGDGFFIGNTFARASNGNYIYGNDGSFSPHNAFECTFSDGNVFEKNKANSSDYGFWLGYSYNMRLTGNEVTNNTQAGIAIEHGQNNEIDRNTISRNQLGIQLWGGGKKASADYRVHHNNITLNTAGTSVEDTARFSASRNQINNNISRNLYFSGSCSQVEISHNNLLCENTIAVSENLAYNKPVTASTGTTTAARAVDGIVFDPNSAWVPDGQLNPGDYWQVDLGSVKPVAEVVIYPYYINLHDFPYRFHIDISSTGAFAGEQIRAVTETSRVHRQVTVYEFAPVSGRYIRFVSDDDPRSWVQMMEFAAFSQPGHYPVECQYSLVNDMATGNNISALRNWWGTIKLFDINQIIFDHNDNPGKGYVFYNPFLLEPIPATSGTSEPQIEQWATATQLPQPSAAPFLDRGQQLIFFNGYVYLFGGQGSNGARLTEVYYSRIRPDGTLGPWALTTSLPGLFYDHVVVRTGNRIYMITGAAGATSVYYASIQANGSLSAWAITKPLPPSRQSFAAVAYGNYVYASGGNSGGTINFVKFASVKEDGSLNSWVATTPLPEPVQSHTMAAYDGFLYVMAPNGHVYYAAINSNGTVGAWVLTAALPQPMSGYASFEHDGYLYLLDGNGQTIYQASIKDDGALNPWQAAGSLPESAIGLRVGAYNNVVYAIGGYNSAGFKNSVYYSKFAVSSGGQGGEKIISLFQDGLIGGLPSFTYEGLNTVTVHDVGQASGGNFNDAFYVFADQNGNPITPYHPTQSYNWVLTINGQKAELIIPDGHIPAYRPDHRYTFQIYVPSRSLSFGVNDLYTPDNTGRYVIGLCGGTP
jgi:parallel beta-helix repeat protein